MKTPDAHCAHDYRPLGTTRAPTHILEHWACDKCGMQMRAKHTTGRVEFVEVVPGCPHDYQQTSAFYLERSDATHTVSQCTECGARKTVEKLCGPVTRGAA